MTAPILGYATNCYSGESAEDLIAAVRSEVAAVRRQLPSGQPLNLSIRISSQAARELNSNPRLLNDLRAALDAAGARVVGANAFPISAPRGGVYKDGIYAPDWTSPARLESTVEIARAVAALVEEGERAILTTLTGTYRQWSCSGCTPQTELDCARNLRTCAEQLEIVSRETMRDLVLALEPEPYTTAESLPETLRYFKESIFSGGDERLARRRLAVNLDLCHAAVMFEDPIENLRAYAREGINVAGLHVSAALRLPQPGANAEGLAALGKFDEPVFLHQVSAVDRAGQLAFRSSDLAEFLALPKARMKALAEARIHFHVPIFAAQVRGLATTADQIPSALAEARTGNRTNLFIVETYTWKLLEGTPGAAATTAEGVARELVAARGMLGAR